MAEVARCRYCQRKLNVPNSVIRVVYEPESEPTVVYGRYRLGGEFVSVAGQEMGTLNGTPFDCDDFCFTCDKSQLDGRRTLSRVYEKMEYEQEERIRPYQTKATVRKAQARRRPKPTTKVVKKNVGCLLIGKAAFDKPLIIRRMTITGRR